MSGEPASTGKEQSTKFKPGQSGNPAGRKKGARNKVTMAVAELLDGQYEAITQAAVDKALEGDTVAMRLCLDRIAPAKKDGPVSIDLPPIKTVQDAVLASQAVLSAVANGEVTPDEAGRIMALLATHKQLVETGDIEQRIEKLEAAKDAG